MRIAVVSDDGIGVSQHFGRAPYYVVFGVNAVGQPSPISNRTGRFNFTLVPGN